MEWGELAIHLGLSRAMLDFARKGQRNLSFKALRRLEQAERDAGISLQSRPPQTPPLAPETDSKKTLQFQEMGGEKGFTREEIGRVLDDLKRLTAELERIYKRK